jgi:hypothetical protein
MHSKQTVVYICKEYASGNRYYYKKELITHDKWTNLNSLAWSTLRPISEKTYLRRKKAGYKTEYIKLDKRPALIIPFRVGNTP